MAFGSWFEKGNEPESLEQRQNRRNALLLNMGATPEQVFQLRRRMNGELPDARSEIIAASNIDPQNTDQLLPGGGVALPGKLAQATPAPAAQPTRLKPMSWMSTLQENPMAKMFKTPEVLNTKLLAGADEGYMRFDASGQPTASTPEYDPVGLAAANKAADAGQAAMSSIQGRIESTAAARALNAKLNQLRASKEADQNTRLGLTSLMDALKDSHGRVPAEYQGLYKEALKKLAEMQNLSSKLQASPSLPGAKPGLAIRTR